MIGAILEARPILLLDKWAADQDPASRAEVYNRVLPDIHARGTTIIAITHDDRFFHLADSIYRMEGGCLTPLALQDAADALQSPRALPSEND
ncbi:hypothetical protein [Muricoccus aerilatus]|uniref:hypothetical protein n=1 Tax=Muricoccus aerilatus TaxID=452982 RepID=UPI000693D7D4|nr:hypothetical protein [Roseomonas aerilata]